MLALAGCTRDADVEPARPVESGKVVLTGLSGEVTRTGFGEASEGVVPFRWSAGDCILVGDVKSEPLESSGEKGAFVFESVAEADSYDAVSYTHLDVYKRQLSARAEPVWRLAW